METQTTIHSLPSGGHVIEATVLFEGRAYTACGGALYKDDKGRWRCFCYTTKGHDLIGFEGKVVGRIIEYFDWSPWRYSPGARTRRRWVRARIQTPDGPVIMGGYMSSEYDLVRLRQVKDQRDLPYPLLPSALTAPNKIATT